MSNAPQDAGWWQASDGKWYPPREAAPAIGWWLASDGRWYPPADVPGDQAPDRPGPRRNPDEGLSPQEQIARRNQASQADAAMLARSRTLAASRLLNSLATEIEAPSAAPASAGSASPAPADAPLLVIKPSALATDITEIGERIAIFDDRVELRDRHDVIRQSVPGTDITDIVVHKRLTGAVLTIETVAGPVMVAKGLRPEQAEEARSLIMRRTRPTGPVQREQRSTPRSEQRSAPRGERPFDEADVLSKLGDLHRLGILTTEEYENKIAVVGRLLRGEITLPA